MLLERGLRRAPDAERITLKHNGRIPADQTGGSHSDFKQQLRVEFSKQIRRHWRTGLLAEFYAKGLPTVPYVQNKACSVTVDPDRHPFFRVENYGFSVIPLVNWHNGLNCEVDFTFLGDERGAIDLDNQMKVVFDALRMPLGTNQVPGNMHGHGEDLFCVLEDDSIVRKYCVESRYGGTGSPPDEELLVKVHIGYVDNPCHPALDRFR